MKKLIASLFLAMTTVALVYINYHAIKDSVPFFVRLRNKVTGSKTYARVSGLAKGTKTKVSSAGGRVVHMFKRRETA